MSILLYNTLGRKKEIFKPLKKGQVGIYSCGPTVYSAPTIGNMRAYLFSDLLKRTLIYNKLKVKHIVNITDVGHLTSDADEGEDKIEKAAIKEGKKVKDVANFYFKTFISDLKKLNIIEPDKFPKASEHIKEQVELVKKLEKKKFTYWTKDGVYFDTSKLKDYGKLALLNVGGLKAGKRVDVGEKRNKTDFALWKLSDKPGERQQEWASPWGTGYPGWHLECSAMSMKYLGDRFDIHTGGEDHISVHHTNEIAQSEAVTGKKFVNYWMHSAFLTFNGEKVSKSSGGLYTISELEEQGFSAMACRYLFLQTHYRKQLEFSIESLEGARNAYERIRRKVVETKKENHKGNDNSSKYEKEFLSAINDDLNTPQALKVFWAVLDDFNFSPKKKIKLLEKMDKVLGLGIKDMREEKVKVPEGILRIIEAREQARKEKNWAEADILREQVKELGYLIEDSSEGFKIRKI